MPKVDPLVINTLGAIVDGDYSLTAYCYDMECQHSAALDVEALAKRLGREHGSMRWDLVPKLRCTKCGGKDVGLRLAPPTGSPGRPYVPKAKR